jgi:hypothetical protein
MCEAKGMSGKGRKRSGTIICTRDRTTHALQTITADMLHRVWDELDYRVDGCRVAQGAHIEGL